MRRLILVPFAVALALMIVGALVPELFALTLIGLVLLAGTATVGVALVLNAGPRPHY